MNPSPLFATEIVVSIDNMTFAKLALTLTLVFLIYFFTRKAFA